VFAIMPGEQMAAPNGRSHAMAATSDRHVVRLVFQSRSVLIADFVRLGVGSANMAAARR
jgi:hypothetical protein